MYFRIIFIFSGALCISAEAGHKLCHCFGCFDSGDTEVYSTFDGDELYYVDFKKTQLVWDSKIPTTFRPKWAYEYAQGYKFFCNRDKNVWRKDKSVTQTKEPPDVVIYARDEAVKDEENTLICFINNFFPPKLKIKWTKNNKEMKVDDSFIKTIANSDGSFHTFSYLNIVPEDGDIYSCTVEHEALKEPKSRFWESESEKKSSGPAVFCGLGLTLGLLGVAAGTFIIVKGKQH